MTSEKRGSIQRRLVWSGWLRLAHAGMALSTLVLIATAWLLQYTTGVSVAALDYHYIAGAVLAMSLILRAVLLFTDRGAGNWRLLRPSAALLPGIAAMTRFYLSFGKAPLPNWYAHNPFWTPLYLLLMACLAVQTATGYLMDSQPLIGGLYLPDIHDAGAWFIQVFVIAHLVAVCFHDAKGTGSDISAMLSGYRVFIVRPLQDNLLKTEHSVPVDSILGGRKPPK